MKRETNQALLIRLLLLRVLEGGRASLPPQVCAQTGQDDAWTVHIWGVINNYMPKLNCYRSFKPNWILKFISVFTFRFMNYNNNLTFVSLVIEKIKYQMMSSVVDPP